MNDPIPVETIAQYRAAVETLHKYVRKNFPVGTNVRVNQVGRYVGDGISQGTLTDAAKLPVMIPNGNVWWYDLENITRIEEP